MDSLEVPYKQTGSFRGTKLPRGCGLHGLIHPASEAGTNQSDFEVKKSNVSVGINWVTIGHQA